jgi:iron complex transport system substrate-binding protein
MRIASLQPSVTLTLHALGRADLLCAHTKYCIEALPELAAKGLPVLRDSWTVDTAEILAVQPTLVMASVPYRMESLAAILKTSVPVLALAPKNLATIFGDIRLIASIVRAVDEGEALLQRFQCSLDHAAALTAALHRPTVYCEEWGKPLIRSQAWVAELVHAAGGSFLGAPGTHTDAEAVAASDPDIIVFAWCGAGDRVPLARVIERRNWAHLKAVREHRVYCIPDEYLNTPAHTLGRPCPSKLCHSSESVRAHTAACCVEPLIRALTRSPHALWARPR